MRYLLVFALGVVACLGSFSIGVQLGHASAMRFDRAWYARCVCP